MLRRKPSVRQQSAKRPFSEQSACSIPHESLSYSFPRAKRFHGPATSVEATALQKRGVSNILRDMERQYQQIFRTRSFKAIDKKKDFTKASFKQLYLKRTKKYVYDLYGNRMPIEMVARMVNLQKEKRTKNTKKENSLSNVFSASRRLDLSLPLNFNPGPGSYFHQRPKQELKKTMKRPTTVAPVRSPPQPASAESRKSLAMPERVDD